MKYDDASWHYGGDFPRDLPPEAGATHIGMFLAWSVLNGLAGSELLEISSADLERLRRREITPGQFFIETCDEKLVDAEFSEQGNAFASHYYTDGPYITDYETVLGRELDLLYYVADTWANYDLLSPMIQRRFDHWQNRAQRHR